MIAPPRAFERHAHVLARGRAGLDEGLVALQPRERNEAVEDVVEEETHPHAGAAALAAEPVDAVVPVARLEQRQAVFAAAKQRVFDRAARVLVDVADLARRPRHDQRRVLAGGHRRPFEIRGDLVEHAGVARSGGRSAPARRAATDADRWRACAGRRPCRRPARGATTSARRLPGTAGRRAARSAPAPIAAR